MVEFLILRKNAIKDVCAKVAKSCWKVDKIHKEPKAWRGMRANIIPAGAGFNSERNWDMGFLEDVIITDSIEVKATPEEIYTFLTGIVDDEGYRAWHEQEHVAFRWVKGPPWVEGSVMYVEEYLHGKLHKLKLLVTRIVPNERIEYVPTSRLLRLFLPKNEFIIERTGEETSLFIASGTYRLGWIGKTFFKKAVESALASVRKHMKEEGENLKRILESRSA